MRSLAYRVDEFPPESAITTDPFPGRPSMRLELHEEWDPGRVCALITDVFFIPCAADHKGAWLDLTGASLSEAEIRKIWKDITGANGTGDGSNTAADQRMSVGSRSHSGSRPIRNRENSLGRGIQASPGGKQLSQEGAGRRKKSVNRSVKGSDDIEPPD